jgi:endogenous inhibitor of DNA gyrase (YacG/DUF329 family)
VLTIQCAYCGTEVQAQRTTKRFCSTTCAQRQARGWPQKRACRHCGQEFEVRERADANRQHCSKECAKNHNAKRIGGWLTDNPGAMKRYNQARLAKNPGAWRDKHRSERERIIDLLGGACVVCGVTNPHWLHVDFIPTTREMRYRHPRHYAWVSKHLDLFRVLCANHHYELTLTGRIEGTSITQ